MAERSDFTALLEKGHDWFWESYDMLPKMYPEIFRVDTTKQAYIETTSGVGVGRLYEKGEFEDITSASPIEGYTIVARNREWAVDIPISKELQDDVTKLGNFMRSMMPQLSEAVVDTKEEFYAKFFNKGGYTAGNAVFNGTIVGVKSDDSGDLAYDSKPFFNLSGNNRSSKGGGTYYNGEANDFSKANLQSAYTLMTSTNNRRENDTRCRIVPDIVLAKDDMYFSIKEVLDSPENPTTSMRSTNVAYRLLNQKTWQYLDDTDAWFLGKAKKGLVALERKAPEFDIWEDKKKKAMFLSVYTRFGGYVENWRYWYGSNFSTS